MFVSANTGQYVPQIVALEMCVVRVCGVGDKEVGVKWVYSDFLQTLHCDVKVNWFGRFDLSISETNINVKS